MTFASTKKVTDAFVLLPRAARAPRPGGTGRASRGCRPAPPAGPAAPPAPAPARGAGDRGSHRGTHRAPLLEVPLAREADVLVGRHPTKDTARVRRWEHGASAPPGRDPCRTPPSPTRPPPSRSGRGGSSRR